MFLECYLGRGSCSGQLSPEYTFLLNGVQVSCLRGQRDSKDKFISEGGTSTFSGTVSQLLGASEEEQASQGGPGQPDCLGPGGQPGTELSEGQGMTGKQEQRAGQDVSPISCPLPSHPTSPTPARSRCSLTLHLPVLS